jgi:uncharacterized lipoprotein YajG
LTKAIAFSFAALLLLSACSTTSVNLRYEATSNIALAAPGAPVVTVGTFIDKRGEPAHWLGAIRGGFGNPLKNIESDQPVAILVAAAFSDGLRSRRFTVSDTNPVFELSGVIRKLACNQIVRREANVDIELHLTHLPSGRQTFVRTYAENSIEGSMLSFNTGVFASVQDLRLLTENTLQKVVDNALDDKAFRNALYP